MAKKKPTLTRKLVAHRLSLLRLAESAREKVIADLSVIDSGLLKLIYDSQITDSPTTSVARTESLIIQSRPIIASGYATATTTLTEELMGLAQYEQEKLPSILDAFGATISDDNEISDDDLSAFVSSLVIVGFRLRDWWSKQTLDTQLRFAQQARMSSSARENSYQLLDRIVGKSTNNRTILDDGGSNTLFVEKSGGILNTSYYQASGLVHTSSQAVSSSIDGNILDDNSNQIDGYQAVVTLDGRTSDLCLSRAGGAWSSDGNPWPGSFVSISFPGFTPWHWKCRTFLAPILKGQQPDEAMTFSDWIEGEDEDVQKDVLGPKRFELWKQGHVSPDQMIDQSGNRLTLEQLRGNL